MFALQHDGNLVMYTTIFPMYSTSSANWFSGTVVTGFQVIFNQSGLIYVVSRNGSKLSNVLSNEVSMRDFYQRAVLEYDGVFRQYVYPKTAGSGSDRWPMSWSTLYSIIPENICQIPAANTGSGACGVNSYCRQDNDRLCTASALPVTASWISKMK